MANILTSTFTLGYRLFRGEQFNTLQDSINNAFNGSTSFAAHKSVATGLTAAGTNQATALVLSKDVNVIGTAAASTGAVLPSVATVGVGASVEVFNDGANAIKVYGAGSDTIDGTAGATGVTLTNASRCRYLATASGAWKSSLLGAVSS